MGTPGGSSRVRGTGSQRGDLPRLTTEPRRRGGYGYDRGGYDRGYGFGSVSGRSNRSFRGSSKRWGFGGGCVYGCSGISARVRIGGFRGSFVLGYPIFAVPVVIPYYHHVDVVEHYDDVGGEAYAPEPARAASKLIVVGGGSGGGSDALTVESLGDSVRLSWLANGRQAREVKLFVADSAKRELATRSASPASPTATFEVATLSAPVAFAGVTVVFADGVTSTTLVPYRGDGVPGRPR
jgi:hypothetical protein